ncbi:MAG: PEP/pyruvate-binding domain-containing protein [Verrucomicrobiota bacterium]
MSVAPSSLPHIRFFGLGFTADAIPELDDVGGKGINLCKLTVAKFPVPPGFLVTTEAYRQFVSENHMGERVRAIAESIDENDVEELERLSASIREIFAQNPIPKALEEEILTAYRQLCSAGSDRVAVRSSATAEDLPEATFAGQQDTYLNISGEASVLKHVKSCWGSLWTARAVAYRAKQETSMDGLAMAVVVQQMARAEAAGVMFTANPVTGAKDEIVINAAWGLGESIVGGNVTPDNIVVDKPTLKIKAITVAEKTVMTATTETGTVETEVSATMRKARVLDDDAVARLAELGRRIEQHYGTAQDIEWAVIAGGQFAMLQARPIRGLDVIEDTAVGRQEEINRLRAVAGANRRVWVTHNLGETLPSPTPLTWDIIRGFMSGNGGFGRMYQDLGYQPSEQVCREGFLELIAGRIYADPERAAQLFWGGMPLSYDLDAVAKNPTVMDAAPTKFDPARADGKFLVALPGLIRRMLKCSKTMKAVRRTVLDRFEKEILPPYLKWVAEKRRQNLAKLSVDELRAELRTRVDRALNEFGGESLMPGFFGGLADASLKGTLTQLMGQESGTQLALELTQALEGDTTIAQSVALSDVAQGKRTIESFLEEYGHRTVEEMELSRPRWREDSSYINQMLAVYKGPGAHSPEEKHHRNVEHRQKVEHHLPETLRHFGGSCLYEDILIDLKDAQRMLPYRESGKHYLMMGYETIRLVIVELAKRWDLGRDIFFLTLEELQTYEGRRQAMTPIIASRKLRWQSARRLEMAAVVDSQQLDELGLPKKYDSTNELHGDPIASGIAVGMARIVFDPTKAADFTSDYVLVCPSTDPGWTALFVHAKALIVERGGVLSHGAIVARDFGIPALVCPDATRRIPDRTMIRVDGNHGRITFVEAK